MAMRRSGKNSISLLSSLKLMVEFFFLMTIKNIYSLGFSFSFKKLQFNLLEDTIYE